MRKINSIWFGSKILWIAVLLLILGLALYGVSFLVKWSVLPLLATLAWAAVLTDKLMEFSASVQIVAFVGLKRNAQRKLARLFRDKLATAESSSPCFVIHYANDLEKAKEWLAGQ